MYFSQAHILLVQEYVTLKHSKKNSLNSAVFYFLKREKKLWSVSLSVLQTR